MKKTLLNSIGLLVVLATFLSCRTACSPSLFRRTLASSDSTNHVKEIVESSNGEKLIITNDTLLKIVTSVQPVKE